MAISSKMKGFVEKGGAIRKMFEEGLRLKALYGPDKVFDFSIGNPNLPPPALFKETLAAVVAADDPDLHSYMPNAGLPSARAAIAAHLSAEQGIALEASHVVVTCGAAGGLNIVFKALLEPDDEVLVSSPYFVEYGSIADNHGGKLKVVPSAPDFSLDVEALEAAISAKTKIVLVNTPNNPSGKIYSSESLQHLAQALERKSAELGHIIYLVSDEPYRKLVYDNCEVPSPLASYPHSLLVTSYSKDLSLPGERIGYVAVNPAADDLEHLLPALSLANRILGFVNAPSLMQKTIAALLERELKDPSRQACVDISEYKKKRDILAEGLRIAGYEFNMPEGAFYLFPKIPGGNEAFLDLLKRENILVVSGKNFGCPGYFRIAYCVEDSVLRGALPGFERAIREHEKASGQPAL